MNAINGVNTNMMPRYNPQSPNGNTGAVKLQEKVKKSTEVGYGIESIIKSSKEYVDTLRTQRIQSDSTALKVKKLKYQYKNISSRILRSKTSIAAKQAAGQARREVIRLTREKANSEEDSAEIDAAINHAKAMERVARKKARHLEQEEMAKAGSIGSDKYEEETAKTDGYTGDESAEFSQSEEAEVEESQLASESEEYEAETLDFEIELTDELMTQMLEEYSEEMLALLEEIGLEQLSDFVASSDDMDPEDLKMMKIKHRNKEMKDIVKADAEYLKAVFDNLEKSKNIGAVPESTGGIAVSQPMPNLPVPAAGESAPTINIVL